jgi:hypothetical protein
LSSALIASAKISNLNVYNAVLYLLPTLGLASFLGYIFLIRRVKGRITYKTSFSLKELLTPLGIILAAPILDFTLKRFRVFHPQEIATMIGVCGAFILACKLSKENFSLIKISREMRPWNFTLIIIGMFIFLNIFKSSNVTDLIATIPLSPLILCVVAGFGLGFATGRVLLPASITIPVYLTTGTITPPIFTIIYTGIFFGYVISPVHPCVCVSCEYFNVSMKEMLKLLSIPAFIIFFADLIIAILLT